MTFDYARYLAAKTTVDDRALNRHVLAGLCRLMPAGAPALAAGSSDWVVTAGPDGSYPGDEAYFLRSILDTIQNALRSRQAWVEPADVAEWLAVRGRQLATGELVYIAHQLDFVGRSPG